MTQPESRNVTRKPHDNYKLWTPQPDPATVARCPICASPAEVWQYSANPDAQLQRVVMCTNGEAFGPQLTDGMTLLGGCLLYMPPDDFYRARTVEAVKYWNEYAKALNALRGAVSEKVSRGVFGDAELSRLRTLVSDYAAVPGRELYDEYADLATRFIEEHRERIFNAVPLDAAGQPKLEATILERVAVEALNEVKAWLDSDLKAPFPDRTKIEAALMLYEQRRVQRPSSCPHADPFFYCETCKVDPCPLGFEPGERRGC